MLPAMVAFCRTSTHVEVTQLFPLFSAYLCIYINEDTIPDLLMSWLVFSVAIFPHCLFRYFVIGVVSVVLCLMILLRSARFSVSCLTMNASVLW